MRPAPRAPSPPAPAARSPHRATETRRRRRATTTPRAPRLVTHAGKRTSPVHPERAARARAARPRAPSDSREARALGGPRQGRRASAPISASRFLCGRFADRLSTTRRSPRSKRDRTSRCRQGRLAADRAEAERHDVDAVGGDARQCDQVVARALRVGDDALRATGGPRHQQLHPLVADTCMRLGEARVDQVVHGHDPAKAAPTAEPCSPCCAGDPPSLWRPAAAAASARRAPTARGFARSPGRSPRATARPTDRLRRRRPRG